MLASTVASADIWIFEPSLGIDQRIDDNYGLSDPEEGLLSVTRAVAELRLGSESERQSIRGIARVDGLLTTSTDAREGGGESTQILGLESIWRGRRSRFGVDLRYTQDRPGQDIASDLTDEESVGEDTGLTIGQSFNVSREEYSIEPGVALDLSRRLEFTGTLEYTRVEHGLPDPQDAIYRQYIAGFDRDEDGNFVRNEDGEFMRGRDQDGEPIFVPEIEPFSEVTLEDVGNQFTPTGELDDFDESEIELGLRYSWSPVTDVTATLGHSEYRAEVEPDPAASVPFEDLIEDPQEREIRRKPRRDSLSSTSTLKLGLQTELSRTLDLLVEAGVYVNRSDATDTLRESDIFEGLTAEEQARIRGQITELEAASDELNRGWLANAELRLDAGRTQYVGRFLIDIQPSSAGSQVETNELVADLFHTLSPRTRLALRGRAYEPDRLGAREDDRFSRRFLSLESRIDRKLTRAWSASAGYRYRRQKARIDPQPADSHAILISLRYTPPSRLADERQAGGL